MFTCVCTCGARVCFLSVVDGGRSSGSASGWGRLFGFVFASFASYGSLRRYCLPWLFSPLLPLLPFLLRPRPPLLFCFGILFLPGSLVLPPSTDRPLQRCCTRMQQQEWEWPCSMHEHAACSYPAVSYAWTSARCRTMSLCLSV